MSHPDYKNVGVIEVRVIEECAEVIQAISKAQRFGYSNFHPDDPDKTINAVLIGSEINDLLDVLSSYRVSLAAILAAHQAGEGEGDK